MSLPEKYHEKHVVSIKDALKKNNVQTIHNLSNTHGGDVRKKILKLVAGVGLSMNITNNINEQQVEQITDFIMTDYSHLTLDELGLCFKMLISDQLIKIYGRLDLQVFIQALNAYIDKRDQEMLDLNREAYDNQKEEDKKFFEEVIAKGVEEGHIVLPESKPQRFKTSKYMSLQSFKVEVMTFVVMVNGLDSHKSIIKKFSLTNDEATAIVSAVRKYVDEEVPDDAGNLSLRKEMRVVYDDLYKYQPFHDACAVVYNRLREDRPDLYRKDDNNIANLILKIMKKGD